MSKKTALILPMLMLGMIANGAQAKDWSTVRIGVEGAYPPFSQIEANGQLKGFDIDITRALCRQMQVKCRLVVQDWDGMIPGLLARKYDAIIASMSITEERKKKIAFSEKYYQTPAGFARKKGDNVEISAAGLRNRVVGVQRATIHDNFITDTFGTSVEIKRYDTQDAAYLDAVSGRLDLLFADVLAMNDGFIKTDRGQGWELFGPNYTDVTYFGEGAGVGVRQEDNELREMFNDAISALLESGVYDTINDKYFEVNIY